MTTYFGYLTVREEVIALINEANPGVAPWLNEQLVLTPSHIDWEQDAQNLVVTDGRYLKYQTLEYTLRDFGRLFQLVKTPVLAKEGDTIASVVEKFCSMYNLPPFLPTDFIDEYFLIGTIHFINGKTRIRSTFSEYSLGWIGEIDIYIEDGDTSLVDVVTTTTLEGFSYPDEVEEEKSSAWAFSSHADLMELATPLSALTKDSVLDDVDLIQNIILLLLDQNMVMGEDRVAATEALSTGLYGAVVEYTTTLITGQHALVVPLNVNPLYYGKMFIAFTPPEV